MDAKVRTILEAGMEGLKVEVECKITNGLPSMTIVGSAGSSINESRERVRNAILSSSLSFPRKRITINLAPGDIHKTGASLDLSIAVAILAASQQIKAESTTNHIFIGELGLDGSLKPVRGIIGRILAAQRSASPIFVVPKANLAQLSSIPNLNIIAADNLTSVANYLNGDGLPVINTSLIKTRSSAKANNRSPLLDQVIGQEVAKRALNIAAAGGHNLMLIGPPGTGKTMLAQAFTGLLPPMSPAENLEVTHLHSLVAPDCNQLMTLRPFRAPHHSASYAAITGGGLYLRPGEISLSHRGVLFLDELPEFNRQALESLRQPLESNQITLTRAAGTTTYPANFILIATANPCPCGHFGATDRCKCSAAQISNYQRRLSGPLLDRIDLFVNVEEVKHERLLEDGTEMSYKNALQPILDARAVQLKRYKSTSVLNSDMDNAAVKNKACLSKPAKEILDKAAKSMGLSARGYMKTIKVARTVADLDKSSTIEPSHVAEALQYRLTSQKFTYISA